MPADAASKVRLGVFVVSGLLLGVAAVFVFGAGRLFERTAPVFCYFDESVQGLEPGADISYRGVKIGRVRSIRLHPMEAGAADGPERGAIIQVEGRLDIDAMETSAGRDVPATAALLAEDLRRRVRAGLRVRLAWRDITGSKYLDVDFLDPAKYPIPTRTALGFVPEEPWLPTARDPTLQDIQQDVATTVSNLSKVDYPAIGRELQELLGELRTAVAALDAESLGAKLGGAADSVRDLARSPDVGRAVAELADASARLDDATARLDRLLAKPETDRAIDDAAAAMTSLRRSAEALEQRLPDLLASVDALVADTRRTIDETRLAETGAAVRETLDSAQTTMRRVGALQVELGKSVRDVAGAVDRIGRFAAEVERHPEVLLAGRERGEDRP